VPLRPMSTDDKRTRQKLFQFLVVGKSVLTCVRGIGRTVGEVAIESLLRPLGPAGIELTRIDLRRFSLSSPPICL